MIEINLLPGDAKKKKRGKATTGSGFKMEIHPGRWFAGLADKITDKYMLGAVAAVGVSGALLVLMFISQTARAALLDARENKAVKDSAQYSAILTAKAKAEATRDSLYQQIAIIKSIDDSRYEWSHLMYEISNALPQYTWLIEVSQTSPPKSVAMADTVVKKGAATATADTAGQAAKSPRQRQLEKDRAKRARADSLLADAKQISFKIIGHTVDIQALTRFMKSLEASPFIQNVQLSKSDLVQDGGKEVTEFTLVAETQSPPPYVIKTVPLVVSTVQ